MIINVSRSLHTLMPLNNSSLHNSSLLSCIAGVGCSSDRRAILQLSIKTSCLYTLSCFQRGCG